MLLAGSPPFFDASEPRLLRSIMQANYDFDTQAWDPVRQRGGSRLWLLLASATLGFLNGRSLPAPWHDACRPGMT